MGEISRESRVDIGMKACKCVFQPGERWSKLIKHDAVVLHLSAESGSLEYALAIPVKPEGVNGCLRCCLVNEGRIGDSERQSECGGKRRQRGVEPFIERIQITRIQQDPLGEIAESVVLAVKDGVDCGQRNVLITPAVTTDKVCAEQFIVILAGRCWCTNAASHLTAQEIGTHVDHAVPIGRAVWRGRMSDVEKEALVDTQSQ